MSFDEVVKSCDLSFGEYAIAVNLNYYRRSDPTEKFWELWKSNKQALKALGFGVYRDPADDRFYVYDWSRKDQATQAQYDEQEAARMEDMYNAAYASISDYISREPECKQKRKLLRELEACHDYVAVVDFVERNMTCSIQDLL